VALVQKLLGYGGIKKQSAKDSLAATPAIVGFGINSGTLIDADIQWAYEDLTLLGATTSDRGAPTTNRLKIQPKAHIVTRAMPSSLASFVLAALGTDSSVTTTHTLTPALALPYWGLMGKYGVAPEIFRLNNAKLDKLKISVDETSPVSLEMDWLGTTVTPDFTWTATNDDSVIQPLGPFGATLQFDFDSATPATEPVSGFSVEIDNHLQAVWLSKLITPDDIIEGEQTIEGTITVKPINLDFWQNILTGTAAGTTERGAPLFGSISLTITNGTQSIVMSALRVQFIGQLPDSDPAGGAVEIPLAFQCVRPTDATAMFTAVVINTLSGAIT
jgi:hypothetical protein